jgi:hypothetical protein
MTTDLPLWRVFTDATVPTPPELKLQAVRDVCSIYGRAFANGP